MKLDRTAKPMWEYFGFSYMPEAGRVQSTIPGSSVPTVAFNSLPLWLRGFDPSKETDRRFRMLPDQKSNRQTGEQPVEAQVKLASAGDDQYVLTLHAGGAEVGEFVFARDRQKVMLAYRQKDGRLAYTLKSVKRTDYWTIR
jgi:hypothetical protein